MVGTLPYRREYLPSRAAAATGSATGSAAGAATASPMKTTMVATETFILVMVRGYLVSGNKGFIVLDMLSIFD